MEISVDVTPHGIPVIGPLIMLAVMIAVVAEVVVRGTGSRLEFIAPVGFLIICAGIMAALLWLAISGCLVAAAGLGVSKYLRWRR
ncbi:MULTISPECIES: hypothetical protein [unclassified Streptomyces]|uniref:hypothetical protein n=1 Tax=unclassified Streptomyces TaxID=2593676 RepID=UPI002E2E089B|nr:hypothetical protein [Streptomyces sp. NBC_00223]